MCGCEASLDSPSCALPSFYIPVGGGEVAPVQRGCSCLFFFPNDASGMQGPTEQDGALLGWGSIPGVLDC